MKLFGVLLVLGLLWGTAMAWGQGPDDLFQQGKEVFENTAIV